MENDLISRSALLEQVQFRHPVDSASAEIINACVQITRTIIEDSPAVDAVEVVRCRECMHRKTERCQMYWESEDGREQYNWETDDDFCSSGKRRI